MPRDAWLAAFAFAGLALLATWPAAMHLTTDLMGDGADAHSFLWNAWWIGQAVASGASPYATKLLFWPGGATLALHTLAPLVALPEAGLARVVGSVAAYDVLMIGSFAFAAWAGYLLARDVTGSRAGAFVAGAAFGFAPFHAAHALGHLNLVWYGWIALFLLAWRRHDATGSRGSLAAAAGALVAAALTDYALALLAALLAFALLVASPRVRERRAWGRLAAPGLVALLLLSPLAVAVVASYAAAPEVARASAEAPRYSLDLLSFFVPTPLPSLYAHVGHVFTPDGTATEANAFLGVTLLALAAWGVAHSPWRETRLWVLAACAFALLALGPRLTIAGREVLPWMPYALLDRVPLLDALRTPARFALPVMLCVSMLAGLGVRALPRRPRPALAALACALLLVETSVVPFPAAPLDVSPLYAQVAGLDPAALVELPLREPGYEGQLLLMRALAAQTQHGVPLVNGFTSRETERDAQFLRGELVLSALWRLEQGGVAPERPDIVVGQDTRALAGDLLDARGLRAIMLHRSDEREAAFVATLGGIEPVASEGNATLLRARATIRPSLLVDLTLGWHGLEERDGAPFRWTYEEPHVALDATRSVNGTLVVTLSPQGSERHLVVLLDGREALGPLLVRGVQEVRLPLDLAAGAHDVTLRSVEPARRDGDDPREIAWNVRSLRADLSSP